MIRNRLQPILWIFRVLKKDTFRVQMSKSALLGSPSLNIAPEGINNEGEIDKKMVRSYHPITRRA
jgi:hypothetical protein